MGVTAAVMDTGADGSVWVPTGTTKNGTGVITCQASLSVLEAMGLLYTPTAGLTVFSRLLLGTPSKTIAAQLYVWTAPTGLTLASDPTFCQSRSSAGVGLRVYTNRLNNDIQCSAGTTTNIVILANAPKDTPYRMEVLITAGVATVAPYDGTLTINLYSQANNWSTLVGSVTRTDLNLGVVAVTGLDAGSLTNQSPVVPVRLGGARIENDRVTEFGPPASGGSGSSTGTVGWVAAGAGTAPGVSQGPAAGTVGWAGVVVGPNTAVAPVVQYQNNADGAATGVNLASAGTGGASGDAFTYAVAAGTPTLQATATAPLFGTKSYVLTFPSGSTAVANYNVTQPVGYDRVHFRWVTLPAASGQQWFIMRAYPDVLDVYVQDNGSVILHDHTHATIYTSPVGTVPWVVGTEFMIEYAADIGTGTADGKAWLRVWVGSPLVKVVDQLLTGLNLYTATGFTSRRLGNFAALTGDFAYMWDAREVGSNFTLPGPYIYTAPVVAPVGNYDIVIGVGQSNMRGAAQDYDLVTDYYDPDVWQYHLGAIIPAVEPLYSDEAGVGLGAVNRWVRQYIAHGHLTAGRHLLIVQGARGGTGFSLPDSNGNQLTWEITAADDGNGLYWNLRHKMDAAFPLAGTGSRVVAILTNHGSTDGMNALTAAVYRTRVTAFIDAFRTWLFTQGYAPTADTRYLMMQVRPSILGETRFQILDAVLQEYPAYRAGTRFFPSPVGTEYEMVGNTVHFNAAGDRVIGAGLEAQSDLTMGFVTGTVGWAASAAGVTTPTAQNLLVTINDTVGVTDTSTPQQLQLNVTITDTVGVTDSTSTLDQTNLLARWRADDIPGVDGDLVAAWPAATGTAVAAQSTAGSQPVLRLAVAGLNGHQAVEFDGAVDSLALSGAALDLTRNAAALAVFVVYQRSVAALAGARDLLSFTGGTSLTQGRFTLYANSTALHQEFMARRLDAVGGQTLTDPATAVAGHAGIMTGRVDWVNTTAELYDDGALVMQTTAFLTAGSTSDTPSLAAAIGSRGNGAGEFFAGTIAEVLVYADVTATQRDAIHTYLARTYGIGINLTQGGAAAGTVTFGGWLTHGEAPMGGVGTGSIQWPGTAAGTRTSAGTAAGAFNWITTGAGIAPVLPVMSGGASGAITWAGSAAASRAPVGAGLGAVTFAGAVAGQSSTGGTATGTVAWAGAVAGSGATRSGLSLGAVGWAGSGTGAKTITGIAAGMVGWAAAGTSSASYRSNNVPGAVAWVGSAIGSTPVVGVNAGACIGTLGWAATGAAAKAPLGTSVGTVSWATSGSGTTSYISTATGTVQWSAAAAGFRSPGGSATAALSWPGTATGSGSVRSGAITGSVAWAGSAAGGGAWSGIATGGVSWVATGAAASSPQAVVTGSVSWAGQAGSTVDRSGPAAGNVAWTATATAQNAPVGSITTTITWTGQAQGLITASAAVAGMVTWTGAGVGQAPGTPVGTGSTTISWDGTALGYSRHGAIHVPHRVYMGPPHIHRTRSAV